jgi:hypothetical protein
MAMIRKHFAFLSVLLLAITLVSTTAFRHKPGPVYLYIHNPETGRCDIKDAECRYTPVERGTLHAIPIQGNLGNSDGSGSCDTIYVIENR